MDLPVERRSAGDLATMASSGDADGRRPGAMRKRSVVIAGHRTSVSLENAFWGELKALASERGITVNQLVTEIDRDRDGNLSSAIRVFVLLSLRANATPIGGETGLSA